MSSFWEQITESNAFCQTGCVERCRGEADEDELDEEFARIVYQAQDERIATGSSLDLEVHVGNNPCPPPLVVTTPIAPREKFSLPWADLNGNQKDSLVTSPQRQRSGGPGQSCSKHASPTRSLLPFSEGSTGLSFNDLYRPIFVTGIPTKAYQYKPNLTDPIDVEVHRALRALSSEASQLVALRRVEAGRYEIEGRTVAVYWASSGLLVHENEVLPSIGDMPLQGYINLVTNVAMDLQRLAKNETFFSAGAAKLNDPSVDGDDRYRAMQVACMQAKIREEGAERQRSASLQNSLSASRGVSPSHR